MDTEESMEETAQVHVSVGQVGADQHVCDLPENIVGSENFIRQGDMVKHEVDQMHFCRSRSVEELVQTSGNAANFVRGKDGADQDYRSFPENRSRYEIANQQADTVKHESHPSHTCCSLLEAEENTSDAHNGKGSTPLCSISQVNCEIHSERAVEGSSKDVMHSGEGITPVCMAPKLRKVKSQNEPEKVVEATLKDATHDGEGFLPVCSKSQFKVENQLDEVVEDTLKDIAHLGEPCVKAAEMDDEDMDPKEQVKVSPGFVSAMLRDGSLSTEGLASKGFYIMEDDDSEEDSSDDDTGEEMSEGANSDDVSSDSEDEDQTVPKEKVVRKVEDKLDDFEDLEPARTKHELLVFPPVSKVTAVLEPHHEIVCVGRVTSVLDLSVIVEAHSEQKILNEKSILWLSETRTPLGFVDEVFGPVKSPYYLVRFNESDEIPPDAKVGSSVSYVSEFSDFVLKENPDLYKRAVDASGLDDEELGSDEDQEFSDDEKEAAARRTMKNRRANGGRETRSGEGWNKTDVLKMKGTRKENVKSGAARASLANETDLTTTQECALWQSSGPGCLPRIGRHGNHGRNRNSAQNSGQEQTSRMVGAFGANRAANGCNSAALLVETRHQSRDGANLVQLQNTHTPNFQVAAQQQTFGMSGVPPFNSRIIPPLLGMSVQQHGSSFQPYPFSRIPSCGQLNMQRHGISYTGSQGSHINIPQAAFNVTGMERNSFNIPGDGQVNMCPPGYVPGPPNHSLIGHGIPAQLGLREMQSGVHPSHLGLIGAAPIFGTGLEAQEYGYQPPARYVLQGQLPLPRVGDRTPYSQSSGQPLRRNHCP